MRLERNEFFKHLIMLLEERSTCERAQVGAIAVRDNRVLLMGYNGAPSGHDHCIDVGCSSKDACYRTIHAEANVVALSAKLGIPLDGATIYCSYSPCINCAKLLINTGIKTFHYYKRYRDRGGILLLINSNIECEEV